VFAPNQPLLLLLLLLLLTMIMTIKLRRRRVRLAQITRRSAVEICGLTAKTLFRARRRV